MKELFEGVEHFFKAKIGDKEYDTLDALPLDKMEDNMLDYLDFVKAMVDLIYKDKKLPDRDKRKDKAKKACTEFVRGTLVKKAKVVDIYSMFEKDKIEDILKRNAYENDRDKQEFADSLWHKFMVPLMQSKSFHEYNYEFSPDDPDLKAFVKLLKTISQKEKEKLAKEAIQNRCSVRKCVQKFIMNSMSYVVQKFFKLTVKGLEKIPVSNKVVNSELMIVLVGILTAYLYCGLYSQYTFTSAPVEETPYKETRYDESDKSYLSVNFLKKTVCTAKDLGNTVYDLGSKAYGYATFRTDNVDVEDITIYLADLGIVDIKNILLFNESRILSINAGNAADLATNAVFGNLSNVSLPYQETVPVRTFLWAVEKVANTANLGKDSEVIKMLRSPRFTIGFLRDWLLALNKWESDLQREGEAKWAAANTIADLAGRSYSQLMFDVLNTVAFTATSIFSGNVFAGLTTTSVKLLPTQITRFITNHGYSTLKIVSKNVFNLVGWKWSLISAKEKVQYDLVVNLFGILQSWFYTFIVVAFLRAMIELVEEKEENGGRKLISWVGRKTEVLLTFYINLQITVKTWQYSFLSTASLSTFNAMGITLFGEAVQKVNTPTYAVIYFVFNALGIKWASVNLSVIGDVLDSGLDFTIALYKGPAKLLKEKYKEITDFVRRQQNKLVLVQKTTGEGRAFQTALLIETTLKF